MKNVMKVLVIIVAMILMISCEADPRVPYDPPDEYPSQLIGEWILVDKDDAIAADSMSTIFLEDEVTVVAYCEETLYLFSPDNTGYLTQTFKNVSDGSTYVEEAAFEYSFGEPNDFWITMVWEDDEITPLATGLWFRNKDVLFCDFLHNDVREYQTHLSRNR